MHPILFRIGRFDIACYGPLIAIGILLGVFVAVRRARKIGVNEELVLDLAFFGVIVGFVGARFFFILNDLKGFFADPWPYIFSRQGYVFFGGLIFAAAFAIWYVRRKKSDPWQVADVLAPSIPLAHTFGRFGCFASGCCYGRVCPAGWESWGVRFPKVTDPYTGDVIFSFSYLDHLSRGWIGPEATHSLPIFPVQLYEAGANFLIFLGLTWLWRRRRFRGQIIAAYLAAYGTVRFLLEFIRGDYDAPMFGGLLQRGQISQAICLAGIGTAAAIWLKRRRTPLEAASAGAAEPQPARERKKAQTNASGKKRRKNP